MNEPSNFCDGECATPPMEQLGSLNTPPYAINNKGCTAPLNKNTISMDANQHLSTHYNMHNLYGTLRVCRLVYVCGGACVCVCVGVVLTKLTGWSESRSTYRALRKLRQDKRPVIISRSTYPGHGRHAGHWLGDNASTWTDLYMSIPGILNFQMFGIPLVGADICGFGTCSRTGKS
jgi:alpha-glucosidase (family GH31 glycosyl hydrolase)